MKTYDLIVAGGGLTGVAAAVSAAREGYSVLLAEKDGCLGGAMSNSFIYPFMRFHCSPPEGERFPLSAGIFTEMMERHQAIGGVSERGWQPEIFKIMLDDMVMEAGVDVLFHALLIDVITDGRRIKAVRLAMKDGLSDVSASFFIDATGDGDLMAFAGCDYQLGRESDGLCQPMTTCFRVSGVDVDRHIADIAFLQQRYKEYREEGKIKNPRENILGFCGVGKGVIHFNTTRVVKHNPVDPLELSRAEMEARRQVLEMYNFLCDNSEAYRDAALVAIAQQIGVRESRKLKGVHVLTAEELINRTEFEDTIALGNYDIDIHNPEGTGTYIHWFPAEEFYRIPYRCLLPKEFDNLLVAGRCLSATHEAHSAVRIMPICATLGQAAGTAAAQAMGTGRTAHTIDIAVLQEKLKENGAAIR